MPRPMAIIIVSRRLEKRDYGKENKELYIEIISRELN